MTSPTVFLDERYMLRPEYETRNYDLATDSRTMDFPASGIKIAGTAVSATAAELNYVDVTTVGTVQATKAVTVDADKRLIWTTTSSTTVNPISFTSTMTGAGTTGGRAYFEMTTNVALGGWANAIKAFTNFGASGSVSGLGSALVAEINLEAGTTVGTYAPLESEIVMPSGASTGTSTSFLYCNISGTDEGTANANMFLFELGAGVTINTGDMIQTIAEATVASTHSIKIKIAGTTYYIPINTAQTF
jgi:hypothetical protein